MGEIGHSWISLVNWCVRISSALSIFEGLTHYSSDDWARRFLTLQVSILPVDIQQHLLFTCFFFFCLFSSLPNTLILFYLFWGHGSAAWPVTLPQNPSPLDSLAALQQLNPQCESPRWRTGHMFAGRLHN